MSQENVELVQRWIWGFEHDRAAFQATLCSDIEWCPVEDGHSPSHGLERAVRIRDNWIATWDEHRVELEEVVDAGDSVVASAHITAKGSASGVEVDLRLHMEFRARDGRIAYVYEHQDKAEALEAVGLSA